LTRERLFNIGTTAWMIALVIGALLYVTGTAPAFAAGDRGRQLDCGTACDTICLNEESSHCEQSGGTDHTCWAVCGNGAFHELDCPAS